MKLSIWSSYYYELSPEEAVERFCKNGIYCFELSDEHGSALLSRSYDAVKTGKEFARFIRTRNFEVSQGHLWIGAKICSDDTAIKTLFRWIDLYEAIGIENMVLHCDDLTNTTFSRQEKIEKNVEKLRILAKYIENKNITICVENICLHRQEEQRRIDKYAEDLLQILALVDSPRFGICLDTGHLNITDQCQRDFIFKADKKLKALHIADNAGQADQHKMPYNGGNINFAEVIQALREIKYDGVFNLEIPGEIRIPIEPRDAKLLIPIELRDAKLLYIKECYNYLLNL